jgi:hypothetical protein
MRDIIDDIAAAAAQDDKLKSMFESSDSNGGYILS